ncbi:MAG: hypothetical protein IJL12_08935 [Selenomonadaceae bacterium]|nr:hypothetical protein [Selenomonadaceae bacterium]
MRDLFGDTLDEAILAAEELLADYFLELEQQQANEQTKVFPGDVRPAEVKRLEFLKEICVDTAEYAAQLDALNEREEIFNAED